VLVSVDAIEQWPLAQERVIALVRDIPDEQAARHVPACPDWTVRDLLSHMVGLGADVAAGDEPHDHDAAWTQRQVDLAPTATSRRWSRSGTRSRAR
jgi:hypothetical protein